MEAQRQAEEAQKAAEAAEAQRYTQELYRWAEEAMRQGEQHLNATRWAEATNEFVKVRGLFDESLEVAKRARAKQTAEAARDSTLIAQRKTQEGGASELFPEGVAEAVALLCQAEQKLTQEDYNTAQAIFERSTALFRQVCEEAVVHLQREQAKGARARAHELQDRLSSVKKGRQQRRAHKTLAQGDRLFQQGSYAEARVKYEEAISLFSALLEASLGAPPERKLAFISGPYLYAVFVLGLLSVVIVLYLALHPSYRETHPEIAEGKKALEQRDLGRAEEQKRLAEEVRREAEAKRLAEEQQRRAEAERLAEEQRRKTEEKRLAEEQRRRTQAAQIEALLSKARQALTANRLTTPAGDNAVEYAEQLLALAPKQGGARQVLIEVVGRYVALGEIALSQGKLREAQRHRDRTLKLTKRYGLPDAELRSFSKRIASIQQRLEEQTRQRKQQEASEFAGLTEEQRQLQKERERLRAEKARLKEQLRPFAGSARQDSYNKAEKARLKEQSRQPPPPALRQDRSIFLPPSF